MMFYSTIAIACGLSGLWGGGVCFCGWLSCTLTRACFLATCKCRPPAIHFCRYLSQPQVTPSTAAITTPKPTHGTYSFIGISETSPLTPSPRSCLFPIDSKSPFTVENTHIIDLLPARPTSYFLSKYHYHHRIDACASCGVWRPAERQARATASTASNSAPAGGSTRATRDVEIGASASLALSPVRSPSTPCTPVVPFYGRGSGSMTGNEARKVLQPLPPIVRGVTDSVSGSETGREGGGGDGVQLQSAGSRQGLSELEVQISH